MANTTHKKRGSALTLSLLLVVLIAITAYIIVTLPEDVESTQPVEGAVAKLADDKPYIAY